MSASVRERVGLVVAGPDSRAVVELIVAAEEAGVGQVWMTQGAAAPDTLGIFAAAAMRTLTIGLGTAIVPTYPRHPLVMAGQALAVRDLAPGRLRLGVGPSHKPVIEGMFGLSLDAPLRHLREYVAILRGLLNDGRSEFAGEFYRVNASLTRPAPTPVLISALREGAFRLAGEISALPARLSAADGAARPPRRGGGGGATRATARRARPDRAERGSGGGRGGGAEGDRRLRAAALLRQHVRRCGLPAARRWLRAGCADRRPGRLRRRGDDRRAPPRTAGSRAGRTLGNAGPGRG